MGYPVLIEYELTPYSYSLQKIIEAMAEWGTRHRKKIEKELASGKSAKS